VPLNLVLHHQEKDNYIGQLQMLSLKKNDMSVFSLQLTTEAALALPDTGVARSKLLCCMFWQLLQSQKASLALAV